MTKDPKAALTDEQLARLGHGVVQDELDIDELLAEGEPEASDEVLSDDDAVKFTLDELSGMDYQRVETLLASSPEARKEMAWLRQEADAWKGPAGEQRVRAIARSIVWRAMPLTTVLGRLRDAAAQGLGRLSNELGTNFPLAEAVAADRLLARGEGADGLIRWELVRGNEDSLEVRLASWATSLDGTTVRLSAGAWVAEPMLGPIGPGEVGATVTISKEERPAQGTTSPPVSVTIEGAGSISTNAEE